MPGREKYLYRALCFIYGLGANGEAGVTTALDIIQRELDTTMALCGERLVTKLGHHNLLNPPA
jgi:L-lactate dehydrogenase (cytochrome)